MQSMVRGSTAQLRGTSKEISKTPVLSGYEMRKKCFGDFVRPEHGTRAAAFRTTHLSLLEMALWKWPSDVPACTKKRGVLGRDYSFHR